MKYKNEFFSHLSNLKLQLTIMGFQNTTFGFLLSKNDRRGKLAFLRICFSEIQIGEMVFSYHQFKKALDFLEEADNDEFVIYTLNDDVKWNNDVGKNIGPRKFKMKACNFICIEPLSHKDYPKVRIGKSFCCSYMLFVAQSDEGDSDNIEWSDVLFMKKWKDDLVEKGIINSDVKLKMVTNCCS